MNNYIKTTFFSALLLTAGCTKHILGTVTKTTLSDASAFSTSDKIQAAVNALYSQVEVPSYYGGRFIVFSEQRGDEVSQNDGNNASGANVWNQSITASGNFVNVVWNAAYAAINSANLVIKNVGTSTVV